VKKNFEGNLSLKTKFNSSLSFRKVDKLFDENLRSRIVSANWWIAQNGYLPARKWLLTEFDLE